MFEEYKRKKLETKLKESRESALSDIRGERLAFEGMVQRARIAGEPPDDTFVADVLGRLADIERRANEETSTDELDGLSEDAEQQGQLRAYVCSSVEIRNEGTLSIDLMEEWNVPKTKVDKLRRLVEPQLQNAVTDPLAGRSALRDIFDESDSWRRYTSDYEDEMKRLTRWWLALPTLGLLLLAIVALRFPLIFPIGLPILLAGAAGSCVSVMAKMPVLEVGLSGELESYERRILSRIAVGMSASLIGCGLLAWGVISLPIQGHTFADIVTACSTSPLTACTGPYTLIVLAIPILFGFSERALTWFEKKVFGASAPK
jgi:hypothetical protein